MTMMRGTSLIPKSVIIIKEIFAASLHLAHRNHLLSEIVLVFADTAIPPPDCLLLTYHDVLGDLV
jgi:hypothetical protein